MTDTTPRGLRSYRWRYKYKTSAAPGGGPPLDILHDFYIPVLRRACRYDRVAGYFRSTSLAAASPGFSALVGRNGHVRMIVGADLAADDVCAILAGDADRLAAELNGRLADPQAWPEQVTDGVELLAWMVAHGFLEVRVAFLLWQDAHPHFRVLALPEAVRQRLVQIGQQVTRLREIDGSSAAPQEVAPPSVRERLQFALIHDGPRLPNGRYVGIATAPIAPWPHQAVVARRLVETWPYNYLLCDEVGLGKTVEGGLAIQALCLSGLVRRVLIAAPRALTRQWQGEMAAKFLMPFGRAVSGPGIRHHYEFPWREDRPASSLYAPDLVIVSTGLLARSERLADLAAAPRFDIALVDEAHYARRSNSTQGARFAAKYGNLFEALRDGLAKRTRCLWLATATPMQLDAVLPDPWQTGPRQLGQQRSVAVSPPGGGRDARAGSAAVAVHRSGGDRRADPRRGPPVAGAWPGAAGSRFEEHAAADLRRRRGGNAAGLRGVVGSRGGGGRRGGRRHGAQEPLAARSAVGTATAAWPPA